MLKPVFWEKKNNISICRLLKILPRVLSVKFLCSWNSSGKKRRFLGHHYMQGTYNIVNHESDMPLFFSNRYASRKHAYIILTPLNPTFI